MTSSLARRTLTTAVSLACCTGLLGLVLGFGAGVWWGHREPVWYVDVLVSPQPAGGYSPCGSTRPTPRPLAPLPAPF